MHKHIKVHEKSIVVNENDVYEILGLPRGEIEIDSLLVGEWWMLNWRAG